MDEKSAQQAVHAGKLVAVITIPAGFSDAIDHRETTPLPVQVDNIDTDMTADIQRALPSAIASFGRDFQLPGIHTVVDEQDLIAHDTEFIPYMLVSSLGLIALIISGILGAITTAREFEAKTIELLTVSPISPLIPILGRIAATSVVSAGTLFIAVGIIIKGYTIVPVHGFELMGILAVCIVLFGLFGAALGAILQRTLPVASLIFGISLPLYLFSGTYEPERFDGNIIWGIAHLTPLYYVVGILEHAVLDLRVTPESIQLNFFILMIWGLLFLTILILSLRRKRL
jgi:ABC-type multidrug transport system permease subunit